MLLAKLEYKHIIAVVFVAAMFMNQVDATVINVALPTLARDFGIASADLQWVITGYLISFAVMIPFSGWAGDKFGTKKAFLFALGAFTFGSALCGIAGSAGELILFRVIQGAGGGMLTPTGTAMLFRAFPPQERAKAAVFLAIPTLFAPMIGPVFGGWLIDVVNWRWIFYINLPTGAIAIVFAFLALKEHTEETSGGFDFAGFVLSGVGLALLLFALTRGADSGWSSVPVIATGLTGLALLTLLVVVELRLSDPMLNLRLLGNRLFRSTNLAFFGGVAGLFGMLFLLPLYLQQMRGLEALDTGLLTLPQGIGLAVFLRAASRIYPRIGPRRMMAGGILIVTMTSASFLLVDLETSYFWIAALMFVRGIGLALAVVSSQAAMFSTISMRDMGRATSLSMVSRQVASAIGVAILATVLLESTASHLASSGATAGAEASRQAALMGFHDAVLAATVLGLVGFFFALFIRDRDAADTMTAAVAEADAKARTYPLRGS